MSDIEGWLVMSLILMAEFECFAWFSLRGEIAGLRRDQKWRDERIKSLEADVLKLRYPVHKA